MKNTYLVILILSSFLNYSQNIFPEKFNNCSTDGMYLESDSIYTKTNISDLIKLVKSNLSEDAKKKLKGHLGLQIIVNQDGSSCLISFENETNVESVGLNLKNIIDQNLKWSQPKELVSPIILFNFTDDKVLYQRIGMNGKKGKHLIEQNTIENQP